MIAAVLAVFRDDAGYELAEYALAAATLGMGAIAGFGLLQKAGSAELSSTANGWQNLALTPP